MGAVSRGGDGHSLGDRNAPSLSYVALTPPFGRTPEGAPVGGLFHDGRAATLEAQAGEPILNPIEMALPDKASAVARVRENPDYVRELSQLYGPAVLDETETGFAAIASSIAAFERLPEFSPFDARYDRSLAGEAALGDDVRQGQEIFYRTGSCSGCHALRGAGPSARETFTNYRYVNLGVPANANIRVLNGSLPRRTDRGVGSTKEGGGPGQNGAFKVPGLRNVAITGPYMHNGVFADLRTAILFHLRLQPGRDINPETGAPWAEPEIPESVAADALRGLPPLSDAEIASLTAFLTSLTDSAYEPLLR